MARILMPYAEGRGASSLRFAPRPASLERSKVGIVNNSWRCMNVISDELRARLGERFGVADLVERRISAAQTLPLYDVVELAEVCDAVVVGIGN